MNNYTAEAIVRFFHVQDFIELHGENFHKKVRIPCDSSICRFNKDGGCNKTFAFHPLFVEGKCHSFEYDT